MRKIASEEKEIGGVKVSTTVAWIVAMYIFSDRSVHCVFQWYLKDFDQLSDEDEALEQERKFSVEELTKQFTPEVYIDLSFFSLVR